MIVAAKVGVGSYTKIPLTGSVIVDGALVVITILQSILGVIKIIFFIGLIRENGTATKLCEAWIVPKSSEAEATVKLAS